MPTCIKCRKEHLGTCQRVSAAPPSDFVKRALEYQKILAKRKTG